MTDVKRTVGKGLPPADFHIRAFCRDGQKFVIAVKVEWMNLNDQTRSYRHVFPKELTVEMPQMIDWEEVVRASEAVLKYRNAESEGQTAVVWSVPSRVKTSSNSFSRVHSKTGIS